MAEDLKAIEAALGSPCGMCGGDKRITSSSSYTVRGVIRWRTKYKKCSSCKGSGLQRDQRVFTFSKETPDAIK